MKKKFFVVLMFIMSMAIQAEERYTSLLLGGDSGEIYYSENIDEMHPLASVTKMVNVMVVYDKIRAGEIKVTDRVSISEEARNIQGSRIWMAKGAELSVEELIKATAIYSANNAAYALAEYVSNGDIDEFVELMNEKVRDAGAEGEVEFHTPMGLPPYMTERGMDVGTAMGIYLLSLEALKYPEYIRIASKKSDVIQGTQRIWNRNKLLSKEKGIYGIKTGHHDTAGYNISIVSEKDGIKAITVVFGSPTEEIRDAVAEKAIDDFYEEYQVRKIVDSHRILGRIKVERGGEDYLPIYPEGDLEMFVSNKWNIEIEADYTERVVAPVKKGAVLGEYRVLVEGEEVQTGKIYAEKSIPKENVITEVLKEIFGSKKAEI